MLRWSFRTLRATNIPPTNAVFDQPLRVIENRRLTSSHYLLTLESDPIASTVRAGQFVMLRLAESPDPLLRRPMSVFNAVPAKPDRSGRIQILHKVVGRGTALLSALCSGDRLQTLGPLGNPFSVAEPSADAPQALIVAGGIGIAPFPLLVPALQRSGWRTTLLYGGRGSEDLVQSDWFMERGVEVRTATEDGSTGRQGRVTLLLEEALSSGKAGAVYACGPSAMLRVVASMVNRAAIPGQLSLEGYMGCGIGACLGCAVPVGRGSDFSYVRMCVEGPTLTAAEVLWE